MTDLQMTQPVAALHSGTSRFGHDIKWLHLTANFIEMFSMWFLKVITKTAAQERTDQCWWGLEINTRSLKLQHVTF